MKNTTRTKEGASKVLVPLKSIYKILISPHQALGVMAKLFDLVN